MAKERRKKERTFTITLVRPPCAFTVVTVVAVVGGRIRTKEEVREGK